MNSAFDEYVGFAAFISQIQLVGVPYTAMTGWIVMLLGRVGKKTRMNAYIALVKAWSEIVCALGEQLKAISDALFGDCGIKVCEKVDPAPLEGFGFMVGQAPVSFTMKVVVFVIGTCEDCRCQTEDGNRAWQDW